MFNRIDRHRSISNRPDHLRSEVRPELLRSDQLAEQLRPGRVRTGRGGAWRICTVAAISLAAVAAVGSSTTTVLAKGSACDGGGFRLINPTTGATVPAGKKGVVVAPTVFGASGRIGVRGTYVEFDVRLTDFAIFDFAFTGAPNASDLTGGVRTPVFASKIPDHRGLVLTSGVTLEVDKEDLLVSRTGTGLSMKITAKDCAQGGIFQMEPERSDGTRTRIVHTLARNAGAVTPFYFDNSNFRARVGQFLGDACTSVVTGPPSQFCVKVATRVNIANGVSKNFVARDSAQVATRVSQPDCNTTAPLTPAAAHCGSVSVWDVASGGRMGFVTGEDAIEVANPPTNCVQDCQAQNQVRGRLATLGFPFPVPAGSRLTPAQSSLPLPPLTTP